MNEDEMIKELAQPIIEKLKEVESEIGDREFAEIPQIRLVRQPMDLKSQMSSLKSWKSTFKMSWK